MKSNVPIGASVVVGLYWFKDGDDAAHLQDVWNDQRLYVTLLMGIFNRLLVVDSRSFLKGRLLGVMEDVFEKQD